MMKMEGELEMRANTNNEELPLSMLYSKMWPVGIS